MIGQTSLIKSLTSYNIKTFPQTLLLIGDKGCGKHLIVKDVISPHLKLEVVDITQNISFEYISNIQLRAIPAIYLINTSLITEKEQNILLKFIEEPVSNSFVILISEDKVSLIETIINRCVVYSFEPYTNKELLSFISYKKDSNIQLALKVCNTPGQLIETTEDKIENVFDVSKKIANRLKDASLPNALKISQKINYKEEPEKFDINVFFNSLILTLSEEYTHNSNEVYLKLYNKAVEYKSKLRTPRINKEALMDNFLTVIWKMVKF
jgi:DNA polymerase III delta prime subunit